MPWVHVASDCNWLIYADKLDDDNAASEAEQIRHEIREPRINSWNYEYRFDSGVLGG